MRNTYIIDSVKMLVGCTLIFLLVLNMSKRENCSISEMEMFQFKDLGDDVIIEFTGCSGDVVFTYLSTKTGCYYFKDNKTGKLIEISGDIKVRKK